MAAGWRMLLIRRLGYLLLVTCDRCRPIVALVYYKLVPVIAPWSQLLAPWSLVTGQVFMSLGQWGGH